MKKGSHFPKKLWKVFNICGEILAGKSMAWAKISICSAVSENFITSHKTYVNEGGITCPDIYSHNEWRVGMYLSQHHLTVVTRAFHFFFQRTDTHARVVLICLILIFGTSMLGTKTRKGTETMKFLRRNLNSVWKFIQLAVMEKPKFKIGS